MSLPILVLLFLAAICDHSYFLALALFLVGGFKALTS